VQVRVDRREHRIFRIGGPDVIGIVNAAIGWLEMACESLQCVYRLRVVHSVEAVESAEDTKRRRHRYA
jgi:hypothetical protein